LRKAKSAEAEVSAGVCPAAAALDFPLAEQVGVPRVGASMIAPETFSHLENIKKRAGYLWRFL